MQSPQIKAILGLSLVAICLVTTAGINKFLQAKQTDIPKEDATVVFKKLYAKFSDLNTDLNIRGNITLIDGNEIKEKTTFDLFRKNQQVYHRFDCITQAGNEKVFVQLDTANKYLIVNKSDKNWLKKQRTAMLPFEQLMRDTSFFKVASSQESEYSIEIKNDYQPEIKSCIVKYDPETYTITQTIVQWWKHPGSLENRAYWETIIDYNYDLPIDVNVDEFINTVVKVENRKLLINEAYADYLVEVAEELKN